MASYNTKSTFSNPLYDDEIVDLSNSPSTYQNKKVPPPRPANPPVSIPNNNIEQVRDQIRQTQQQMFDNVQLAIKRDDELNQLGDRAQILETNANTFRLSSKTLKNKLCCANAKMTIILILVVLALIAIIVGIAVATRR